MVFILEIVFIVLIFEKNLNVLFHECQKNASFLLKYISETYFSMSKSVKPMLLLLPQYILFTQISIVLLQNVNTFAQKMTKININKTSALSHAFSLSIYRFLSYSHYPSTLSLSPTLTLSPSTGAVFPQNCFELYNPNHKGQVIKACKTEADGRVVEGNHVVYRISAPTPEEKEEWIKSIK